MLLPGKAALSFLKNYRNASENEKLISHLILKYRDSFYKILSLHFNELF